MTDRIGLTSTYAFGMAVYCVSMMAVLVQKSPALVSFWSLLSGTGYAVVVTAPPALVALYNSNQRYFYHQYEDAVKEATTAATAATSNNIQERGFGRDIAVLDSAFCLSRILLASCMGLLVDWTGAVDCTIIGAVLFALAACWLSRNLVCSLPADTSTVAATSTTNNMENIKICA